MTGSPKMRAPMQSCCCASVMVRREPVCRAHRMWKMVLAAPSFREGAPGLHGVVVIVRGDLTAEPPAHCRLVSDHDLFEIVVLLDCTARPRGVGVERGGEAKFFGPAPLCPELSDKRPAQNGCSTAEFDPKRPSVARPLRALSDWTTAR